jgi:hypothetical protein
MNNAGETVERIVILQLESGRIDHDCARTNLRLTKTEFAKGYIFVSRPAQ